MKSIIPYEHDLKLEDKIAEITSISLEHIEDISPESIEGNFIVSGDYKSHLISVNIEEFNKKIPFSIELPSKVIKDSIKFDINDFTYEIKDNDMLNVKIEVSLEFEEEDDTPVIAETEEIKEAEIIDDVIAVEDEREVLIEDNIDHKETENIIMDSTISSENTYINYHIYIIKTSDTLEDICKEYNVSKELIDEYNQNIDFIPGNKLLIPEIKDE